MPEHNTLSPAASKNPSGFLRSPSGFLRRTLSVSASSSFKRMNQAQAKADDEKQGYRIIGVGSCGTVFEIPGTQQAVKKGNDTKAIWNDFLLTNKIHNAIADTREVLQDTFPKTTLPKSPQCSYFWLPESKDYWSANLERFPRSHRDIGAAFQVDRILPLPATS